MNRKPVELRRAKKSCKALSMSNLGAFALCCALLSASLPPHAFAAEKDTPKSAAPSAPPPAEPDESKQAPLAYIAVTGAPGDGEQALTSALAKRLTADGIKQATALAANVYSVEGIVKIAAAKAGRQAVRIDWTIYSPDGTTLGGVSQTKLVRKGLLDRKWGAAADAAARAAAVEIVKLLPKPRSTPKPP